MAEDQEEKQGFSIARLEQFQNLPKWQIRLFDRIAALFLFLIILIVFGTLIGLLISFLDFGSDEAKITAESFNKILLGIGAVLAVPFLVWRTMIAQDQNKIAQENLHSTTMAKAIELLGAIIDMKESNSVGLKLADSSTTITNSYPNIEVRLGAIYLLEKLAREHEQLHWPIMEILCAYIRENTSEVNWPSAELTEIDSLGEKKSKEQNDAVIKREVSLKKIRVDVQAALTVIGRRSASQLRIEKNLRSVIASDSKFKLDLTRINLARADLSEGNYDYANFEMSSLELVDFTNASLIGTRFDFTTLRMAKFISCDVNSANFWHANLKNSHWTNSSVNAANFKESKLDGSYFFKVDLRGAQFDSASLQNTRFLTCNFMNASFQNSICINTEFLFSNLIKESFKGAIVHDVIFSGSNIQIEDLKHLDLKKH